MKKIEVIKNTGQISFDEMVRRKGEYKETSIGSVFEGSWATHWFKVTLTIPKEWMDAKKEVHLLWNSGSEGMLYNESGKALLAFNSETDIAKYEYAIVKQGMRDDTEGGKNLTLVYYVEMAGCNLLGNFHNGNLLDKVDMNKKFTLASCEIATFRRSAWDLYWDLITLYDVYDHMHDEKHSFPEEALMTAYNIAKNCVAEDESTYEEARKIAKTYLSRKNTDTKHQVFASGHCHIDTAWLWPFSETRRKSARSWTTQLEHMNHFKDFIFSASQAQQYQWVKEDQPELFKRIQEAAKEGRFRPVGGAWVEFDGNVPSGEGMARQFLYGQRFFEENFGKKCKEFFMPDTFGYSPQIPQIMKESGIDYFITQKLSWNAYNTFPHSTFFWQGIDGTKVLAHFPPADTYNSDGTLEQVCKSHTNFKDKGRANESILLYGMGDGGGGPQNYMIERLVRMQDLEGVPKVKLGHVQDFFEQTAEKSSNLLTWTGELYLELHNGTYTSMADNKRANRRYEIRLRNCELVSLVSSLLDKNYALYETKASMDYLWRLLLLDQFHDVLPGTSIGLVYDVTKKHFEEMEATTNKILDKGVKSIASSFAMAQSSEESKHDTNEYQIAFNFTQFERNEYLSFDNGKEFYETIAKIPGFSLNYFKPSALPAYEKNEHITLDEKEEYYIVNNKIFEIKFNKNGRIESFKDLRTIPEAFKDNEDSVKYARELFKEYTNEAGLSEHTIGLNSLVMHHDIPLYWDAWDTFAYNLDSKMEIHAYESSFERESHIYLTLIFKYKISELSSLVQRVNITLDQPRIDIVHNVDWHESHKLLKLYFPTSIHTDYATYDMQYGNIRRATHFNTSWDAAKTEVCMHKYVDLSEPAYGVSFLNDSKYGTFVNQNLVGISLLKSSKGPNHLADMGKHEFTISILPHLGNFSSLPVHEQVQTEAFIVNDRLRLTNISESSIPSEVKEKLNSDGLHSVQIFDISPSNVVLDAIKLHEDKKGVYVMRVHENSGTNSQVCVIKQILNNLVPGETRFGFKNVKVCNILEEEKPKNEAEKILLNSSNDDICIRIGAYQVVSLMFELQ